eukprot:TRINITY_DN2560_c0_g1_i1.p1 TRINITY_DN2560_c0_g1~~TRINITY_DN2560_c0_g1_i1.p1  ORF type:complete len:322 (+),score=60.76 TRINITY_DN2560_c0_g1_i1:95-967(+)
MQWARPAAKESLDLTFQKWMQIHDEKQVRGRQLTWQSKKRADLSNVAKNTWPHMTLGDPMRDFNIDSKLKAENVRFESYARSTLGASRFSSSEATLPSYAPAVTADLPAPLTPAAPLTPKASPVAADGSRSSRGGVTTPQRPNRGSTMRDTVPRLPLPLDKASGGSSASAGAAGAAAAPAGAAAGAQYGAGAGAGLVGVGAHVRGARPTRCGASFCPVGLSVPLGSLVTSSSSPSLGRPGGGGSVASLRGAPAPLAPCGPGVLAQHRSLAAKSEGIPAAFDRRSETFVFG